MRRACKVTLKFATTTKRRAIRALLESYRGAVNFYIRSLWKTPGNLDKITLARLEDSRLSKRYKSQALKQALDTVIATKKSAAVLGKAAKCPVFRGAAVLDAKFVTVESGRGSFDLVVRISTLCKGKRITIPTRRTVVVNKWCERGAEFVQGCALSNTGIVLWVNLPDTPDRLGGRSLGIDIGVNKLLSDSDGNHYGTEFKAVRDKVRRRQPGSKGRLRSLRERDQYINQTVNQLPWQSLSLIAVEDLHDMKRGKSRTRSKSFRRAMAPWTYRRVLNRIECKAGENRVCLIKVDPKHTSRTCPNCSTVSKLSRVGECFDCVACGFRADADFVGAVNVLARTTQLPTSVESVGQTRLVI